MHVAANIDVFDLLRKIGSSEPNFYLKGYRDVPGIRTAVAHSTKPAGQRSANPTSGVPDHVIATARRAAGRARIAIHFMTTIENRQAAAPLRTAMLLRALSLVWLTGCALAAAAGPAPASSDVAVRYLVSIAGLDIGDAVFRYRLAPGQYAVSYDARFRFMVWGADLAAETTGAVADGALVPQAFRQTVESDEQRETTIVFNGVGEVADWGIDPPFDWEDDEPRVPIDGADLSSVLDPLSALVVVDAEGALPAGEVCGGTRRIFTGVTRFDLHGADGQANGDGAVTCRFRYRPVSGHRVGSRGVERLSDAVIPLELRHRPALGAWVPMRIALPTLVGELVIERAQVRR